MHWSSLRTGPTALRHNLMPLGGVAKRQHRKLGSTKRSRHRKSLRLVPLVFLTLLASPPLHCDRDHFYLPRRLRTAGTRRDASCAKAMRSFVAHRHECEAQHVIGNYSWTNLLRGHFRIGIRRRRRADAGHRAAAWSDRSGFARGPDHRCGKLGWCKPTAPGPALQ